MSKLPHNLVPLGSDTNCTLDACLLEAILVALRMALGWHCLFMLDYTLPSVLATMPTISAKVPNPIALYDSDHTIQKT